MTRLPPMYLIGLDLGERRDYTALSVLHQKVLPGSALHQLTSPDRDASSVTTPHQFSYDLIDLDRWRGKGYSLLPDVLNERIQGIRGHAYRWLEGQGDYSGTLEPAIFIVVDHTGVGISVVEEIRRAGIPCSAVMITSGHSVNRDADDYRVPKQELVSRTQVLFETDRLTIPPELPMASVLTAELGNFQAKRNPLTGHDSYGAAEDWRDGNHDDLVLSVALAGWFGEHHSAAQVEQLRFTQAVKDTFAAEGVI